MYCSRCKKQLPDGSLYCNYCGAKLVEENNITKFADKLGNIGRTLTVFITLPIIIIFIIYFIYSCSR